MVNTYAVTFLGLNAVVCALAIAGSSLPRIYCCVICAFATEEYPRCQRAHTYRITCCEVDLLTIADSLVITDAAGTLIILRVKSRPSSTVSTGYTS